jgi:transposase-like protein
MINVLDKVHQAAKEDVRDDLRAIYNARSRAEAMQRKAAFMQKYQKRFPLTLIWLKA